MNKKKIVILTILFVAVAGFALAPAEASSYKKYKCSFKLKAEPSYAPGYGPTYKEHGYRKEWRNGHKGNYGGSAEIYLYKKSNKVTKKSILRVGEYSINNNFKAVVKFRYWNGYKYTNKYKTKSYIKTYGRANTYTQTTNWIPYSVKIYTK